MYSIAEKSKVKENVVHPNHTKAANIIYLSVALGPVNILLSPGILSSRFEIVVAVITLGIIVGLGYLVSKGYDWVKYLLLVLLIVGLIGVPFIILNLANNPVVGVINIIQTVLQVYAVVLLFKIPKSN